MLAISIKSMIKGLLALGMTMGMTMGLGLAPAGASEDEPAFAGPGSQEGYFSVVRDMRRCAWPRCGGYFVKKLNAEKTRCADGTRQSACYVVDVAGADELPAGSVVRGTLRAESFGSFGVFGLMEAEETWTPYPRVPGTWWDGTMPEGKFYQVFDTGIRCIRWPCFSLGATLLNKQRTLTLSGLEGAELEAASLALGQGKKIVVRGKLQNAGPGRVLRIQQLYLQPESQTQDRLCAEYTTADGRFYAKNYPASEQAAAEEWTRLDPEVVSAGYGPGTCLEANQKPCPTEDPPVCGIPVVTDTASSYASVCEFRKVIRQFAGTDGESKGRFTEGLCE